MKKTIRILIKPFVLFKYSYLFYHLFVILASLVTTFLIHKYISPSVFMNDFVEILNGFGVLTAFYILALDKLNFKNINESFTSHRKVMFSNYRIPFGKKLINTVFSATISMFILLGANYLVLMFGKKHLFLLVGLGWYLFAGFFVVLILWHAQEIN